MEVLQVTTIVNQLRFAKTLGWNDREQLYSKERGISIPLLPPSSPPHNWKSRVCYKPVLRDAVSMTSMWQQLV